MMSEYINSTTQQVNSALFDNIAKTAATFTPLLAAYAVYKLREVKEFIIGDGQATYDRMINKDVGYFLFKDWEHGKRHKDGVNRMRDAISRGDIAEIMGIIKHLAIQEYDRTYDSLNPPLERNKIKARSLQDLHLALYGRRFQMCILRQLTIFTTFLGVFVVVSSQWILGGCTVLIPRFADWVWYISIGFYAFCFMTVTTGLTSLGPVVHPATKFSGLKFQSLAYWFFHKQWNNKNERRRNRSHA